VMAELTTRGFSCTDESGQPFTSRMCTQFTSAPAMSVYVGANVDGSLGRLALMVQHENGSEEARSLSSFLIGQFADAGSVEKVTTTIAQGTDDYELGSGHGFSFRGLSDGSVVMWVDQFALKGEVQRLDVPVDTLLTHLKASGHACTSTATDAQECTRAAAGVTTTVAFVGDEKGLYSVSVSSVGRGKDALDIGFPTVVEKSLPGLAQRHLVVEFVEKSGKDVGAIAHNAGYLMDYWPAFPSDDFEFTTFVYAGASCWADVADFC